MTIEILFAIAGTIIIGVIIYTALSIKTDDE
jgi:hypothetical protein